MTFRFIEQHRDCWPVAVMCQTLEASSAGYYAWRDRPTSARRQRQDALTVQIRAVHAQVKARYGSPRIHAELAACGHGCCVNTVARLMREAGIAARTTRKFRHTTDSNHDRPVAENRPPPRMTASHLRYTRWSFRCYGSSALQSGCATA